MANKKSVFRQVLAIILLLVLAAVGYGVYIWNKPARNVMDEKFISITAQGIFDQYQKDEATANKMFLDSAIQVTGEVQNVKKNADGKRVLYLKTTDPIGTVSCTLKQQAEVPTEKTVTIRGICTGYNSIDVVIIEAFQIK